MAAPYSNPFTRAQVIDKINNLIGTSLTTIWSDAKINDIIDTALAEISDAVPYIMVDTYQIETRTGEATSTSSNNLVDATNSQFLSADVGKIIYNKTDNTWASIQSYTSATTVGLSKDIMASGESYEIYNKGCWNKRQINIEDSGDFLWVIGAVYPVEPELMFASSVENMRKVKLLSQNKIAEIDTWWLDDTKDTDANKDIHLYLARQHKLNSLTDLAGATDLTAGYSAGATTIHMDSLATSETILKDSIFYFSTIDAVTMKSRLVYRVTADVTLSGNEGDVTIFPGLECGFSNDDTIQFINSTLTPDLERILIDMVTGQILMAEGISKINALPAGGSKVASESFKIGQSMLERARLQLKALIDPDLRANAVYPR